MIIIINIIMTNGNKATVQKNLTGKNYINYIVRLLFGIPALNKEDLNISICKLNTIIFQDNSKTSLNFT